MTGSLTTITVSRIKTGVYYSTWTTKNIYTLNPCNKHDKVSSLVNNYHLFRELQLTTNCIENALWRRRSSTNPKTFLFNEVILIYQRYQMSSLSMQHFPLFLDNVITSLKLEDTTKDDLCRSYALNYFQTMTQVSPRINKSYSQGRYLSTIVLSIILRRYHKPQLDNYKRVVSLFWSR